MNTVETIRQRAIALRVLEEVEQGKSVMDSMSAKLLRDLISEGVEQIAELQEMNKQSLEVINNLNEVVKIKSRDVLTARKETAEAKDKLHRRNLQIADLKKKIKDKVSINWVLKTLERWGFNDNEQGKRLIEDLKIYQTVNQ